MRILSNPDLERGLLSALLNYGSACFNEVNSLDISDATFTIESHKVIYKCINKVLENEDAIIPDIPLLYSAATELNLKGWFQKDEEVSYLNQLINSPVKEENARIFALKIKKLEIGRQINNRLGDAQNDTLQITGDESINEIFSIIERSIIDCGKFLNSQDKSASIISEGLKEHLKELETNPTDQIGISTGLPVYDRAIGGGLRAGSVNVIGARAKAGKSTLALNIAIHVAELGIPILYLDSEMSKEDAWNRMLACISEIPINDIETGKYTNFLVNKNKIDVAATKLNNIPIYYQSIAGQPLESQISLIKRWIITDVGLKKNGQAKPCLIIYDYLKLMNEEEGKGYQEYQAVGFLVSSLVNFTKKYNFPILSFIQLNRDGISKEDSSTISQSDRVLWFCASLAIFKPKEPEEIQNDGDQYGNRKLIITDCRYGPGLSSGDYINCHFNKSISKITEGKTKFEIWKNQQKSKMISSKNESTTEDKIPF